MPECQRTTTPDSPYLWSLPNTLDFLRGARELSWSCSTQDALRYPVGDSSSPAPVLTGHAGAVYPLQRPPGRSSWDTAPPDAAAAPGTSWRDSVVAFSNVNRPLHRKPPVAEGMGHRGWRLLECACRARAEMLLWGVSSAHRDEEGGLGFRSTTTQ